MRGHGHQLLFVAFCELFFPAVVTRFVIVKYQLAGMLHLVVEYFEDGERLREPVWVTRYHLYIQTARTQTIAREVLDEMARRQAEYFQQALDLSCVCTERTS